LTLDLTATRIRVIAEIVSRPESPEYCDKGFGLNTQLAGVGAVIIIIISKTVSLSRASANDNKARTPLLNRYMQKVLPQQRCNVGINRNAVLST
jgi:hypothetical protein